MKKRMRNNQSGHPQKKISKLMECESKKVLSSFAEFITNSPEDTFSLGKSLGKQLFANAVLAFSGELGTGKTTFIKGLVEGVTGIDAREVNSPTFTYLNIYQGPLTIYHFDLYRLQSAKDFLALGFDEYLDMGGVCCIEWASRISTLLSKSTISVAISYVCNKKMRKIQINS